ncbi:TRAP transporter substrate-binding protein [Noviherbaspirillum sp.]|uniref:TRAP transporter substrate-binding protein n=1 Tax=Noviherbaspirillum sp. TaxID=1926288 RepID=UPI002B48D87A|nr:TRAP transporter substrate-binding protein [Noviherbaspirillum sp.]HJV81990.1 TRAP transporter substrate-binding protein [Noviherbaspirillum sp.]
MKVLIQLRHCVTRVFALFTLIALIGAVAFPVGAQAAPIVMKIGTATLNDSQHQWMKIYAELVEKNSNGQIKVELYPASQLGAIPRMIEGTQFGSIQAYVGPPEFLSGVDSRFEVLSAPGLFKDLAHANRTLQDPQFNAAFLALGANKGLKGIGLFLSGPMGFNTSAPVTKLSDLAGKKFRVLSSNMQMDQMRLLNATPVPMSLGEVVPAMQQGALDGVMTSLPVFTALRFYDAAKHIYETDHAVVTVLTVVSKGWYERLPADLKKVVTDAGQQASKDVYQWSVDFVEAQRQAWVKAGGQITYPTASDKEKLMKMMNPIGQQVAAKKPEEKALFDLLEAAAKRTE